MIRVDVLLRAALGICVAATFFVAFAFAAEARTACRAAHGNDGYWAYRLIDDRKCWYETEKGERLDKDELFWRKPKLVKKINKPEPVKLDVAEAPQFPPPIEDIEAYIAANPNMAWSTAALETGKVDAPPTAEFEPVFVERWEPVITAGIATHQFIQAEVEVRNQPPVKKADIPVFLLTTAWAGPGLAFLGVVALMDRRTRLDSRIPKEWMPLQLKMEPVA